MSPQVMPPDNDEIVIKPDNEVTIGGQNVVADPDDAQLNPDAVGPVVKFELSHLVRGVDTIVRGATGVRIPFGSSVVEIVKKAGGNSQ